MPDKDDSGMVGDRAVKSRRGIRVCESEHSMSNLVDRQEAAGLRVSNTNPSHKTGDEWL